MAKKLEAAKSSVMAAIETACRDLSHDDYMELMDEIECEAETRREAEKNNASKDRD